MTNKIPSQFAGEILHIPMHTHTLIETLKTFQFLQLPVCQEEMNTGRKNLPPLK